MWAIRRRDGPGTGAVSRGDPWEVRVSGLSRRQFIGGSTAATVAASLTNVGVPEPERGNAGGTIAGPINNPIDRENPDLLVPPNTGAGLLANLKYSISCAHR